MLHVTNGDAAASSIRASGLGGRVLPWRDVLHEGPVPAALSRKELRRERARFIAGQGWGAYDRVIAGLEERDAALADFRRHGGVVLWFEHDLYDQLQLIQILDFLAAEDLGETVPLGGRRGGDTVSSPLESPQGDTELTLVSIDRHPEIERFHGLGQLSGAQIEPLFDVRRPVTSRQLELGQEAWRAFRDPDPRAVVRLLAGDTSALPFLGAALRRHLEQFPWVGDGLGRTERQILTGIDAGVRTAGELFVRDLDEEEAPFLGDLVFWDYLRRLASGERPLLSITEDEDCVAPPGSPQGDCARSRLELTVDGRRVLAGEADRVILSGVDFWLGGVHLKDGASWRWDSEAGCIVTV